MAEAPGLIQPALEAPAAPMPDQTAEQWLPEESGRPLLYYKYNNSPRDAWLELEPGGMWAGLLLTDRTSPSSRAGARLIPVNKALSPSRAEKESLLGDQASELGLEGSPLRPHTLYPQNSCKFGSCPQRQGS